MKEHFVDIARIKKSHGIHGHLYIEATSQIIDFLQQIEFVYILINGDYVPYFFEDKKRVNQKVLLAKFDDIHSPEKARVLSGRAVFLEKSKVPEDVLLRPELQSAVLSHSLEGYKLKAKGYPEEMSIIRIEPYPAHLMAVVRKGEQQCLIPFIDDWIVEIDESKKIVEMDLPLGL